MTIAPENVIQDTARTIIEKIDKDLDGIARLDGISRLGETLVKVPYTNIGDEVAIKQINDKEFAIATDYSVFHSNGHNTPICKYYTKCGGCKGQHFMPNDYLAYKKQNVLNNLNYHGIKNIDNIEILNHINAPTGKRKRVIFSVENNKIIGFNAYRSNNIIDIANCPLLTDTINECLTSIRKLIKDGLKVEKIHITEIDGKLDILLEVKKAPNLSEIKLMSSLIDINNVAQIYYSVGNSISPVLVKNPIYLNYNNYKLRYHTADFTQASDWAENILQNLVLEHNSDTTNVLDLFSGYGGYAFNLLKFNNIKSVLAVDTNIHAINAINALNSKVKGAVKNIFTDSIEVKELTKFDAIILNPPRLGAKTQIEEIAKLLISGTTGRSKYSLKKITLVYCNAGTFARDLSTLLATNKIVINDITAVDQFIFTPHIEIVAKLSVVE